MNFDQAVAFIIDVLNVPVPEKRATRDKVRKRVRYGLGDGSLPRLDLQTTDVDRDQLIDWARKKWPGKFNMPINLVVHMADTVALGANADGLPLPSDLQACHAKLQEARRAIALLRLINSSQAVQIARLKPLAEQYERICEKNRAAARKPRSGEG
ncbi:hypothetical protein [Luteimonas mephitis]|uniref:hypothetical protein n=1 Tax=Luteimonas mephitis TaxID=83615 RepID=UPI003A8F6DC3